VTSNRGIYDFGPHNGGELQQGLPPIVGSEGGSTWFAGEGHASAGKWDVEFNSHFYLGIDLQPDRETEQIVLGTARTGGSAMRLTLSEGQVPGRISIMLRDEQGRTLEAVAQGSAARARRVIVTATLAENRVSMFEIQPWAADPRQALPVDVVKAESPCNIVLDSHFVLGGWSVDGERHGAFQGRLAEFFLGQTELGIDRIHALAAASDNPMGLAYEDLGPCSDELKNRFLRELQRVRRWCSQAVLTPDDVDDAALLLHRWLVDRLAILDVLTRRAGVQLWLPGPSEQALRYEEAVMQTGPEILVQGEVGPAGILGHKWVSRTDWLASTAFHTRGVSVSRGAFIKFVRNKLGPGHFDEEDRKRWQRDLLETASALNLLNQDALTFQMKALVHEAMLAVSVARAEALATGA
jgi:hypothetical protein